MIKGVNKKIIEINNPDSLYFEKAVLYLRPNVTIFPETISQKEAQRILSSLLPHENRKRSFFRNRRYILITAMILIIIAILLLL
ncbi:hypothetical protein [Ruminococcus flavefaciens]|uniref:hypothetical protein n=1 Tax=Ruminococcus flavefaciens TaxID=1265 RepID=UPI0004901023|nr:hypothetical protein [Ruminococcus flavefaciens]